MNIPSENNTSSFHVIIEIVMLILLMGYILCVLAIYINELSSAYAIKHRQPSLIYVANYEV